MEEKVLEFITTVRASFGGSIAVYTCGNCYQFYEILKIVFPDAEAFDAGGHVYTKIDNNFYDIRGKFNVDRLKLIPITEPDRIKSLSSNKWTDERRKEYGMGKEINERIKKSKRKRIFKINYQSISNFFQNFSMIYRKLLYQFHIV